MKKCKLGDILQFHRGYDLPIDEMEHGEYPVVGSSGINGYHNRYTTEAPSVSVGRSGNSAGKAFIYYGRTWTHNTALFVERFMNCNPVYAYYLLKSINLSDYATGSAVPTLNRNHIHDIEIQIPDTIAEQKKIANILKMIDDKIEINEKTIDNLESMAKTLYDYWFVQFDFPDDNGHPYKTSGGKMEWNETLSREIPAGWEVSSIGCITENFDSQRIPLSAQERQAIKGEIPYYGATDVMDYVNRPIFKGQYVLIAEDGSVMDANGFPFVQMIYGNSWVNNHAHVLRGKNGYSNERLYLLLKEIPVVSIKTGSIQAKINQNNLNSYNIVIPKRDIATLFDNKIIPVFDKIRELKEENRKLTSLREFLLPMLMNGQVTFHQ